MNGRDRPEPDPDALLAALPAEDAKTVRRWSRTLGLGSDGWVQAPGFRTTVELLAIVTLADELRAESPGLSERRAFFLAAERIAWPADSELDTHPAETPRRRLLDWLRRAWPQGRGEILQPRDGEAA